MRRQIFYMKALYFEIIFEKYFRNVEKKSRLIGKKSLIKQNFVIFAQIFCFKSGRLEQKRI